LERDDVAERTPAGRRADYRHFLEMPTRWMDNDAYGHLNNAIYYAFFDTVINRYLVDVGGFDFQNSPVIGLVPETFCRYYKAISYPELVEGGIRVGHLGRSSVRYEVGLFVSGEDEARAEGHFVHVWVDRATSAAHAIPDDIRAALERIKA
jgi:acyl-CoA thioester hydrolase